MFLRLRLDFFRAMGTVCFGLCAACLRKWIKVKSLKSFNLRLFFVGCFLNLLSNIVHYGSVDAPKLVQLCEGRLAGRGVGYFF